MSDIHQFYQSALEEIRQDGTLDAKVYILLKDLVQHVSKVENDLVSLHVKNYELTNKLNLLDDWVNQNSIIVADAMTEVATQETQIEELKSQIEDLQNKD